MKVKELINELRYYDPEMDVVFSYDYGDYVHTYVAKDVYAAEVHPVLPWEYVGGDKICSENLVNHEEARQVVVLSEEFISQEELE